MMFQHLNLFPHLTVLENCTQAPMLAHKIPQAEAEKYAGELSGGQQQRCHCACPERLPQVDEIVIQAALGIEHDGAPLRCPRCRRWWEIKHHG